MSGFYYNPPHKILFIRIVSCFLFFSIYVFFFSISIPSLTLVLLEIGLHNFFNLFFMRLFQSHNLNRKFNELT